MYCMCTCNDRYQVCLRLSSSRQNPGRSWGGTGLAEAQGTIFCLQGHLHRLRLGRTMHTLGCERGHDLAQKRKTIRRCQTFEGVGFGPRGGRSLQWLCMCWAVFGTSARDSARWHGCGMPFGSMWCPPQFETNKPSTVRELHKCAIAICRRDSWLHSFSSH